MLKPREVMWKRRTFETFGLWLKTLLFMKQLEKKAVELKMASRVGIWEPVVAKGE